MMIDRLGPVDPLKNLGKAEKARPAVKNDSSDSIEVSSEAKSRAEVFAAREAAKNAPEIRMDRVEELKKKINDPAYLASVLDGTAEGIMKSFGI